MMNKQKQTSSGPVVHIGTSFLLVIFIILCLVTFAVLSLSSALRDQGYSQKEALRTSAYYKANGQAQEKLSEIITAFENGRLADLDGIILEDNNTVVSYTVKIDDTQDLEVTLQLSSGNNLAHGNYQITKWSEVSSGEWNGDSTLPVMDSGQLN